MKANSVLQLLFAVSVVLFSSCGINEQVSVVKPVVAQQPKYQKEETPKPKQSSLENSSELEAADALHQAVVTGKFSEPELPDPAEAENGGLLPVVESEPEKNKTEDRDKSKIVALEKENKDLKLQVAVREKSITTLQQQLLVLESKLQSVADTVTILEQEKSLWGSQRRILENKVTRLSAQEAKIEKIKVENKSLQASILEEKEKTKLALAEKNKLEEESLVRAAEEQETIISKGEAKSKTSFWALLLSSIKNYLEYIMIAMFFLACGCFLVPHVIRMRNRKKKQFALLESTLKPQPPVQTLLAEGSEAKTTDLQRKPVVLPPRKPQAQSEDEGVFDDLDPDKKVFKDAPAGEEPDGNDPKFSKDNVPVGEEPTESPRFSYGSKEEPPGEEPVVGRFSSRRSGIPKSRGAKCLPPTRVELSCAGSNFFHEGLGKGAHRKPEKRKAG